MTMEKQSFITLPLPPSPSSSLSSAAGGGMVCGAGGSSLKRRKNLKFILISSFMAIFCVVISFVLIWNIIQTNELNKEVESLRKGLANLKEKIGYDLLAELEKFEVEYRTLEKHRKPLESPEKMKPIPNPVIIRAENDNIRYDNHEFFDDDGDDIDDDDDSNYDDDDNDDDYDDDYEEFITEDERGQGQNEFLGTILEENGISGEIEPKTRLTRSIAYTNQGVPIVEDSYMRAKRRNNTRHKDIPDEWFKHKTVTTPYIRNNKKKLLYDWSVKNEANTNTKRSYSTTSHNIQLMKDRQARHNQYYEHVQAEPQVVYPTKNLPNQRKRRSATLTQNSAGNRHRALGVHYVGQATTYDPQHHSHYDGNGRVLHNGARYRDWKLAQWSSESRMHEYFPISNGIITIREPGLYFIYAQIFYHNVHDTNGYTVHLNDSGNKLMQCTTMTTSNQDKTNTCYTASVHYLDTNDQIYVEDLSGGHYTIFEPSRSFFGLFKIGDIRMNSSAPR